MIQILRNLFFNYLVKKESIVVCLNDTKFTNYNGVNLVYGAIYRVFHTHTCCGIKYLDFGATFNKDSVFSRCSKCNGDIPGNRYHWVKASRFRFANEQQSANYKKVENDNLGVFIQNAINNEDYLLAEKLKNRLNK